MNKTQGFTLLELLVVISIIGLLSSVILSSLSSARDKAKAAAFAQIIRQYVYGFNAYYLDHGYYPMADDLRRRVCLGSTSCYNGSASFVNQTDVDEKLKAYMSSLPTIDNGVIYLWGTKYSGLEYYCSQPHTGGIAGCDIAIFDWAQSNASCLIGVSYPDGNNYDCGVTLP